MECLVDRVAVKQQRVSVPSVLWSGVIIMVRDGSVSIRVEVTARVSVMMVTGS